MSREKIIIIIGKYRRDKKQLLDYLNRLEELISSDQITEERRNQLKEEINEVKEDIKELSIDIAMYKELLRKLQLESEEDPYEPNYDELYKEVHSSGYY